MNITIRSLLFRTWTWLKEKEKFLTTYFVWHCPTSGCLLTFVIQVNWQYKILCQFSYVERMLK